jgi:predicted secreted protein
MQETVNALLKQMKNLGVPTSRIEKELKFANGQLGQVAKGKSKLSGERLSQFSYYCHLKITDNTPTGFYNSKTGEVGINKPKDTKEEVDKLLNSIPKNLQELKLLCPKELTGFDRSQWISEQRQKYNL